MTNYQKFQWDMTISERRKTPLAIVDYFGSEDDEITLRRRYRFVDWERATLHGGGFDLTALNSVFQ